VLLKSMAGMEVEAVVKRGRLVAREGRYAGAPIHAHPDRLGSSMNIRDLSEDRFRLPSRDGLARVIELVPGQILTRKLRQRIEARDGRVLFSPEEDLALLACVERHRGTGNVGLGLVKGFGLKRGALASSVAHDSHNILVLGREPGEMVAAVRALADMHGGLALVLDGKAVARLPLPVAGLMSDQPLDRVLAMKKTLLETVPLTGCTLADPFMALSFLALPVVPELRLTDRGLVDVERQEIVPLFGD
jgi:adenine deaminase